MCDTMVAVGCTTKTGHVLFAKNSDREHNEAQVLLRIPRKKYNLSVCPRLKMTYIEIDQVAETNEIVISKPAWMWGCEMGFNEYSVMIGNEAVFTKEKHGGASLVGMDMIRLALERTKTAKEAVGYIIYLLDRYGQGGNCGYTKKMQYHNSFIVADKDEAYVLETAGKYWVSKKVTDYYSISNGLTLENDFDECHPELIRDSVARKMCTGRADFNFRKSYSDPLYSKFSCCRNRSSLSLEILENNKGNITAETMMQALRAHQDGADKNFEKGSMKSVCMHAGSLITSQTTASLVGELKSGSEYFFTASSLPCISVFKPFVFNSDFELFDEEAPEKGLRYWTKREETSRMMLTGQLNEAEYLVERNAVQKEILSSYTSLHRETASKEEIGSVLRKCMELDNAFVDKMHAVGSAAVPRRIKGNPYFKSYWAKENAALKGNK